MSLEAGTILEGVVVKITHYGAFVELPDGKSGLVHISEIADTYVKDVRDYLKEQERVKVKVLGYNDKGKLDLSVKQALDPAERQSRARAKASFDEKLAKFMKESEERLLSRCAIAGKLHRTPVSKESARVTRTTVESRRNSRSPGTI